LVFHSERETDHSPPSSAEVKEWVELYLHSPNTPSWCGARLGGAQGQLYLYYKGWENACMWLVILKYKSIFPTNLNTLLWIVKLFYSIVLLCLCVPQHIR
jgi:hypothetical protein